MKDADKALMDGLALVTDLREDEWALVVSEVEKAGGVRQVSGMARVEIERAVTKARTLVEKARPPQDPKPKSKPVVPAKRKKQIIYTDGRRYSRALMPEGSDPSDYPTDKYELVNPDGTPFKKAVEPVAKHPGHANQASHGGKGKGGSPSSDIAGRANTRREDEAGDKVGYGANQAAENMGAHSNEMNQKIYGKDGASKKMTDIDEVELMGINDSLSSAAESLTLLSSGKPQKQHDQIISVRRQLRETRSDAVRQLSPAVRNIAVRAIDKHIAEVDDLLSLHREAWTGVGGTFEKAVEPVEKHPGHANQQSHAGGKGGGKAPASSPASPAGGGGGSVSPEASEQVMRAEKILTDAKEGAKYHDVKSIRREKDMMGKATKDEAIGRAHKHDQDFRTASQDSNAYAQRASEIRLARTGDPKAEKMAEAYDADSRRLQTEAAISMKLASAWTFTAMDKGASESDLTRTWSF